MPVSYLSVEKSGAMKFFIRLYMYLCPLAGLSQVNFDNNWILGRLKHPGEDTLDRYGGTLVNFDNQVANYNRISIVVDMNANAAISDSSGQLLFYTDGCAVLNRNHQVMKNGKGINEGGLAYLQECLQNTFGYHTHQGVMILPFPGHTNRYRLLHLRKPDPLVRGYIEDFLLSEIDMTGDAGLGTVTEKNQLILQDTFCDMLTAVRHGNGRDWWLVLPRYSKGEYCVFLLSPQGVGTPFIQKIGEPILEDAWGIQATFSPDGTKYANNTHSGGLQVFDFNRCTGRLSNPTLIDFPGDSLFARGIAVAPNSRYLYASAAGKLYQFDLYASRDIEESRQVVGVYDYFENPLPTTFYQMMLAPDKKIYMTCTNGTKYWHIIHFPDEPGLACGLEQHFELPTVHSFSPPNFPHFRLFDAQGSPCDTLGIDGPPPPKDTTASPLPCAGDIRLYPNPASGYTWVEMPYCQGGTVRVYDIAGRWIEDITLEAEEVSTYLDVSGYVPGLYLLQIHASDGTVKARALAVCR